MADDTHMTSQSDRQAARSSMEQEQEEFPPHRLVAEGGCIVACGRGEVLRLYSSVSKQRHRLVAAFSTYHSQAKGFLEDQV